jgi:tetratricopeptide (TPR) repeat protein
MKSLLIAIFIVVHLLFSCGIAPTRLTTKQTVDDKYIELFHEGIRNKQKNQLENAIKIFESCTTLHPNDDAAFFALASVYEKLNKRQSSISALEQASKLDPANQYYIEQLAYSLDQVGDYLKAVENYKKLVKISPNNVEYYFSLGDCYIKLKSYKEAFETLSKIERVIGGSAAVTVEKFKLLRAQKKDDSAEKLLVEEYQKNPGDPTILANLIDYYFEKKKTEEAFQLLKQLSISDPDNGNVHLTLAQLYLQKNDKLNCYKELVLVFDNMDIELDTKTQLIMYFIENQSKLDNEVVDLSKKLATIYPNEAKTHTLLGDVYMKLGKENDALVSFQNAVRLDPSKPSIWQQVLVMEYQKQDFESLYKDGKNAITYFPLEADFFLLTGTAANQLNLFKEAIEVLQVGKEIVVKNPGLKAEFYALIGQSYFKLKQLKEGQEFFEKALDLSPNNHLNLNNYAYYLANEKIALDKAERMILQVLEQLPNDYHYLDTYGWILFQKGEFTKSLEYFTKAIDKNGSEPLIIEHLGDVHAKLGKLESAVLFWKKAFEKGGKNKVLEQKIEKKTYYDPAH